MTFTGVVLMANIKIATFSNSLSLAQGIALVGSFVLEILVWVWVSFISSNVLRKSFQEIITGVMLPAFLIAIVSLCIIDWGIHKIVGKAVE